MLKALLSTWKIWCCFLKCFPYKNALRPCGKKLKQNFANQKKTFGTFGLQNFDLSFGFPFGSSVSFPLFFQVPSHLGFLQSSRRCYSSSRASSAPWQGKAIAPCKTWQTKRTSMWMKRWHGTLGKGPVFFLFFFLRMPCSCSLSLSQISALPRLRYPSKIFHFEIWYDLVFFFGVHSEGVAIAGSASKPSNRAM